MQRALFFLFLLMICVIHNAYASPQPATWRTQKIVQKLKEGKVLSMTLMQDVLRSKGKRVDFEGRVFLVELNNGLKAVFKSCPKEDLGDAYAEVAAYKASLVLAFPFVPPTVIRRIKGEYGSLQLFIDTPFDLLFPGIYAQSLKEVSHEEIENLQIFYFIFGQWDSGPHNLLLIQDDEGKKHFIAIDNSGIHNHQHAQYGTLPFVRVCYSEALQTDDWNKPFPFEKAQTISKPIPLNLRRTFRNKLPEAFYSSFKSYSEPLKYIIYQNSLWRQFHAFDKKFIKSYTSHCSQHTKKALKKLDLPTLKKIFAHAKGADFLTPRYFNSILERRDQVLQQVGQNHIKVIHWIEDVSEF